MSEHGDARDASQEEAAAAMGRGGRVSPHDARNLLTIENRSIVCIDLKGELAAVTAPYRRTVSDVVIINPFNLHAKTPGYEDLRSDG